MLILIFLFQLTLTSHVSNEDFQLGYSMSGHVERSFEKYISFQITHLAFVRRRDFQSNQLFVYNLTSCFLTFGILLFTDNPSDPDPAKINQSKTARIVKNLCRIYLSSK